MSQSKRTNLLPSHYRILDQLHKDPDYKLAKKDLAALERDYRWGAPGVSDDPSMIDFFDAPRPTLFEHVVRVWNCGYLAAKACGVLDRAVTANIVDIGAGRGEIFRVLSSQRLAKSARINYTALDIDLRKRELFAALYPSHKDRYLVHDFRDGLPFDDGSVNAFICTETLEHVDKNDGINLLASMRSKLMPGGSVILTTPNASAKVRERSIFHAYEWHDDELKQAVVDAGLTITQWFYFGVPVKSLGKFIPADARDRISLDLVRGVMGMASGEIGHGIFCVLSKGDGNEV